VTEYHVDGNNGYDDDVDDDDDFNLPIRSISGSNQAPGPIYR
jgi:hypothetical protein